MKWQRWRRGFGCIDAIEQTPGIQHARGLTGIIIVRLIGRRREDEVV